jgi:uncharacterized protein
LAIEPEEPRVDTLEAKVKRLETILGELEGGVLVAFSGGADSALLLSEARRVLGPACAAVTADSPTLPRSELEEARRLAAQLGAEHVLLRTGEMDDPRFVANDSRRCYFCKSALFDAMEALAVERGVRWVLFGAIVDDVGDWRPGMEAARERGARAPLLEAGLTKVEVRELSRRRGLPTWDKPQAACLSSRFPSGRPITLEDLGRVEQAEALLRELGFRQCRVRLMEAAARVELEEGDLVRACGEGVRDKICEGLRGMGFRFVVLDLEGYRSGSLNPTWKERDRGLTGNT